MIAPIAQGQRGPGERQKHSVHEVSRRTSRTALHSCLDYQISINFEFKQIQSITKLSEDEVKPNPTSLSPFQNLDACGN